VTESSLLARLENSLELALMLDRELESVPVRGRVLAATPEYQLRPMLVRVRVRALGHRVDAMFETG